MILSLLACCLHFNPFLRFIVFSVGCLSIVVLLHEAGGGVVGGTSDGVGDFLAFHALLWVDVFVLLIEAFGIELVDLGVLFVFPLGYQE